MLELGKHTIEAHKNIGKIAKNNVDVLIVVGPRAKAIKEGAEEEGMNEKNMISMYSMPRRLKDIRLGVRRSSTPTLRKPVRKPLQT